MRLTTVLIIASLLQVSAATFGQKITINRQNASLETLFKEIRKQSGYNFFYDGRIVNSETISSIQVANVSVDEALKTVLTKLPLTYEIKDKLIIITKKAGPGLFDKVLSAFTDISVRGRVVDEKGEGLGGATISIKGTKGTNYTTDAFGFFLLKKVDGNATIEISFIGYTKLLVHLENREDLGELEMVLSDSKLDEVQVMAYGSTTKRMLTGTAFSLKEKDIALQNVNNPLLTLQGRVPGLEVIPVSGIPGAGIKVQLRGQNSLSINSLRTEPLFVIDGIPYQNNIPSIQGSQGYNSASIMSAISFIDPSIIESIDVLKDASATSIYGSRGANGVIMITTKKGKTGTTRVNVSMATGFAKNTTFLKLMNTQQYLSMRREAFSNDGVIPVNDPTDFAPDHVYAPDLTLWSNTRYTDWQKELLGGTARNSNYLASISGGNLLIQYLVSGTYRKDGYVFPGDLYSKTASGHLNLTGQSPNQKLKIILTTDYATNTNTPSLGDIATFAVILPPNAPSLYNDIGELNWAPNPTNGQATWTNPLVDLLKGYDSHVNTINTSTDLKYNLLTGLSLRTTVGFSKLSGKSFSSIPLSSIDPYARQFLTGKSIFRDNSSSSWSIEPQVNYVTQSNWGGMEILLGGAFQAQETTYQEIIASGYKNDAILQDLGFATNYSGQNSTTNYKYIAMFTRIKYNWEDKYLVDLSARRDGSSRFGPNNKFGNFAAVGLAWIFTREKLISSNLAWMSFGKLRFSYGNSGNDQIEDYRYLELYESLGSNYGNSQAVISKGIANPYYHWEDVRKLEYGLDIGIFKDKLIISGQYFQTRSKDQLGGYVLPSQSGSSASFIDNQSAIIQNSGFEFSQNSTIIQNQNFTWQINGNLSIQRNKLLSLPDGSGYGLFSGDGDPIGRSFTGFSIINYYARGVDPVSGIALFAGKNGDAVEWDGDNYIPGRIITAPLFTGGFGNRVNYKEFSLDFFFQFSRQKGQNYIYQFNTPGMFDLTGVKGNLPAELIENYWMRANDNSQYQKLTQTFGSVSQAYDKLRNSNVAYTDASFLRLKTFALSYNIPRKVLEKYKVENLRIFAQAQNVLTVTRYKGNDPEVQSPFSLPQLFSFTAGIQLQL